MADYTPLLKVMKQTAKETGNALCPVEVCFGKVVSESPLKVQVEQKITLGKAQLVLTRNVCDYEEEYSSLQSSVKNKQKIYNALKTGEEVLLLRQQGGQKYIILDRVVTT